MDLICLHIGVALCRMRIMHGHYRVNYEVALRRIVG